MTIPEGYKLLQPHDEVEPGDLIFWYPLRYSIENGIWAEIPETNVMVGVTYQEHITRKYHDAFFPLICRRHAFINRILTTEIINKLLT